MVALIALLMVGGFVLLGAYVWNEADDAIDEASEGLGDGGIPGVFGGDCVQFQLAYSNLFTMSMFGGMGAGMGGEAAEAQQAELEDALGEMRGLVPGEIQDDFAVVEDAFQEAMATGFSGGLSGDPDAEAQSEDEVNALLESPEVQEAQANIDAWLLENCG